MPIRNHYRNRLTWPALCALCLVLFSPSGRGGGYVEEKDGKTIIHVKLWFLPDPTTTDTSSRAEVAVVKEFIRRFPKVFAERSRSKYEADPVRRFCRCKTIAEEKIQLALNRAVLWFTDPPSWHRC